MHTLDSPIVQCIMWHSQYISRSTNSQKLDKNIWTARQGYAGEDWTVLGDPQPRSKSLLTIREICALRMPRRNLLSSTSSSIYLLQKAGFSASIYSLASIVTANLMARSVVWKAPCLLKLVMLLSNIWVWFPSKCICQFLIELEDQLCDK